MTLKARLIGDILARGPITVAEYMTRCLHDPDDGYYATRPTLGAAGDFITAPLISQMFGEVLGAWARETWARMGKPERVLLVELGPGDGTLMADVLRVSNLDPEFHRSLEVWLVETSPPLRRAQRERVAAARWADTLREVPGGAPVVILANEYLDCLPVRQAVRRRDGWRERRVGLVTGRLGFIDGAVPDTFTPPCDAAPDQVWEWSFDLVACGTEVGGRIAAEGGAALFIDYGRDVSGPGDTLQAVRGHRKEGPLENPGEADLTAHVDFPAFAAAARAAGAVAAPLETQAGFLSRLGIEHRAEALACARPEQRGTIARQLARLIAPDQMGALFKVAAIAAPGLVLP